MPRKVRQKSLDQLAAPLLAWYDTVHQDRDMPWRQTRDPYAIWLSETMLQQTQVETVKPYYARFLSRFPTVGALAAAPLEEVLALWAGLGYYRRARHLHAAAQQIAETHGGDLPSDVDMLMTLPGVGRYTAGAVGSIAFGLPVPVVDGNVVRVLSRLAAYDKDVGVPANVEPLWELAETIVEGAARPGDLNQAMMELGATVCVPANPRCGECPVRAFCRAKAEGRERELPVKSKRGETPVVKGFAVMVWRGDEVLLTKRPRGGIWEEMWEFPVLGGGDAGAIRKALGVRVAEVRACGSVTHQLTHRRMEYEVVSCRFGAGKVLLPACGSGAYMEARWVKWPPGRGELAVARAVWKVAERVEESSAL